MLLQQIKNILAGLSLFIPVFASAQTFTGNLECDAGQKVKLSTFRGTHLIPVDSTTISDKKFSFDLSQLKTGYYRISLDSFSTDVILSPNESPEFVFHDCTADSISIKGSTENNFLFELKSIRKQVNDSTFLRASDSLFHLNPNSFFSRTSRPYLNARFKRFNEGEFLSNIPFSDASVLRSTILPGLLMQYFRDYVNYDEPGFLHAVDTLLFLSSTNPEVKEYTLEFLLELFHKAGPEVIFEYLVENHYSGESCNGNFSAIEHASRYLLLRPGSIAPDTILKDVHDESIRLSAFFSKHKVSLLYFWSTDCPHCQQEHRKIRKLSDVFGSDLGIIGVSIDPAKEICQATIKEEGMSWPVVCETEGWESPLLKMFLVNKTPTLILIDQKGKLISRNILPVELPARLQDLLAN